LSRQTGSCDDGWAVTVVLDVGDALEAIAEVGLVMVTPNWCTGTQVQPTEVLPDAAHATSP
jgi:hypothetical protein